MSKSTKYFPRTAFSPLYISVRTVEPSRKAIVANPCQFCPYFWIYPQPWIREAGSNQPYCSIALCNLQEHSEQSSAMPWKARASVMRYIAFMVEGTVTRQSLPGSDCGIT